MGNCSNTEQIGEVNRSSNVQQDGNEKIVENVNPWHPAYDEFCFGDSPDDVNKKLPEPYEDVEWDRLPIAYEYHLDQVRYFMVALNTYDDLRKFVPPHYYVAPGSFICLMFFKKRLFRISLRLLHDHRAQNYRDLVRLYARAVNTPIQSDGMFHHEDERIFYFSREDDEHTAIETIEKGNVIPDGNVWNPFPSEKIIEQPFNSSGKRYNYDLMISYSHQDKKLVHQIYYQLLKNGLKVWMDLENMYGSTIDRMAEAIQNSQLILVCMSLKYQTSPYCKTEGQYMYKLQRPFIPIIVEKGYRPYDWLGALVGLRMYIDFTKYDYQTAYDKLIKEIRNNQSVQDKTSH